LKISLSFFLTLYASVCSNVAKNEIPVDLSVQDDVKHHTSQRLPQVQHCWGVPGRPSLADIVKMGRPQAKLVSRSVASTIGMPAVVDSVTSNAPSRTPKESNHIVTSTKLLNGTSEVHLSNDVSINIAPIAEVSEVAESIGAHSSNTDSKKLSTPDCVQKEADLEESMKMSDNTETMTIAGQFSASVKEVEPQQIANASLLDNGSVVKADDFQYSLNSFEHNQSKSS
jgi:hypothetical protein